MIPVVSAFVFLTLLAISLLHLAWALGSAFPCKDKEMLARAVVGRSGGDGGNGMPPGFSSALVAALIFLAALWPLMMRGWILTSVPIALQGLGAIVLILVFLGRGIVGLTPWFRQLLPEEPFVSLNRTYYSPLCIALGLCYLILLTGKF
jgi:Protein of unknown function (DUF3995)